MAAFCTLQRRELSSGARIATARLIHVGVRSRRAITAATRRRSTVSSRLADTAIHSESFGVKASVARSAHCGTFCDAVR